MHDAEPRMRSGEIVEDAAGRVSRTVVYGDDLKIRIVNFHQCGQSGRKFFLFIASRKDQRNSRRVRVHSRRETFQPWEADRAVGSAQTVSEPKKRDQAKKYESKNMHGNWCRRWPQVMLTRDGK